mmetsp:Transcript_23261/g.36267  ORF Transcript_23261/g.36267 Transcript_23261/m.36267 type:complete len:284 (+) Transcript_23261:2190-3041(+)
MASILKFLDIIDTIDCVGTSSEQVAVVFRGPESKRITHLLVSTSQQLVKSMVRSLSWLGNHHSRFLQQIIGNVTTSRVTPSIELDFEIFSETRGVVISKGLSVTEGFQQGIRLQDHTLNEFDTLRRTRHSSNIFHNQLGRHSLSSTRFPRNNDTLVHTLSLHHPVGFLGQSEDMRGQFMPELSLVTLNPIVPGDTQVTIGVNGNQHRPDIGVDELVAVPLPQVVQDAFFCYLWQHDKIINPNGIKVLSSFLHLLANRLHGGIVPHDDKSFFPKKKRKEMKGEG